MKLPSVKTLNRIYRLDIDEAKKVRVILEYHLNVLPVEEGFHITDNAQNAMERVGGCFPDTFYRPMWGTYLEYVESKQDTFRYNKGFEYLNVGDLHQTTLLWDFLLQRFVVSSVADYVTNNPKRFGEEGEN